MIDSEVAVTSLDEDLLSRWNEPALDAIVQRCAARDPVAIDCAGGGGHVVSIWQGIPAHAPDTPSGRGARWRPPWISRARICPSLPTIAAPSDARLVMHALDAAGAGPAEPLPAAAPTPVGITVGATVRHAKFGDGKVVAMSGSGDEQKLTIEFGSAGPRTLLARFVTAAQAE